MDRTEALFSIDVNSGSKKIYDDQEENAFQYNMLAADEIVHQLRLRDIGGIVIVDFIDMDDKDHQQKLYDHVRQLMAKDRAKHNVLPLSKFGLMQITRQRVRPAVEMEVMETCPTCMGKGKIQPSILFHEQLDEQIAHAVEHHGNKKIRLHLHPYIYAYLNRGFWFLSERSRLERKYGIRIIENQSLGMLEARFVDAQGKPLVEKKDEPAKPEPKKEAAAPAAEPKAEAEEAAPKKKRAPRRRPKSNSEKAKETSETKEQKKEEPSA